MLLGELCIHRAALFADPTRRARFWELHEEARLLRSIDQGDGDGDRLAQAMHRDVATGLLPADIVELIDRYSDARTGHSLAKNLISIAWLVVRGDWPAGVAVSYARNVARSQAREDAVERALRKRAASDEARVNNVYYELGRGTAATYVEQRLRAPATKLIRAVWKSLYRLRDIPAAGNDGHSAAFSAGDVRQPRTSKAEKGRISAGKRPKPGSAKAT